MYFIMFCAVFMIIGFVDVIRFITFTIFKRSKNNIKNSDDAEFVIRNLANKSLWNQECSKLICVDSDDDETKKIINLAKSDFEFIDFLPNSQLNSKKDEKRKNYSN